LLTRRLSRRAEVLTSEGLKGPKRADKRPTGRVLTYTYMRVQIDRFEDNGWAVLLPYPDGRTTFDVPRELLPEEVSAGDVFEIRFEYDREETLRIAEENRRLLDELLGGEE
jgi:hypothetical protein